MNRAFSSSEQEAIRTTKVINEDNYYYKTDGGNDTLDKIYLLSLSETDEEKEYGFTDSYGMTIKYSNYADLDDYQYWWLRTPGEKIFQQRLSICSARLMSVGARVIWS